MTPKTRSRLSIACFVLAAWSGAVVSQAQQPPGTRSPPAQAAAPRLLACVAKNGDLERGMPVRYQPFDNERLQQLRRQEGLQEVVAPGRTEFERMLLLKDWVAAQWPHGNPDPYPPWDAITVLEWIRSGKTGGFCGQYAQVLLQSLASLGYTARYVELGSEWCPYNHYVVEAWSNQFNKWIVLDADFNVHFERDGIPLSALEVHDAYIERRSDVATIEGPFREGHPDPAEWVYRLKELFYYMRLHLKADHLSVTNEQPFDRYNDMAEFLDPRVVPWEQYPGPSEFPIVRLTNLQSDRRADFTAKLNQVRVTVEAPRPSGLRIRFDNNVFQFDHYQVRLLNPDFLDGNWFDYQSQNFPWPPTWKFRGLEVRGVNTRGVPGPISRVTLCAPENGVDCSCETQ